MEKRMLIALALSAAVLLMFSKYFAPARSTSPQAVTPAAVVTTAAPVVSVAGQPAATPPQEPLVEHDTVVATDKLTLVFSDIGGAVKSISLNDYSKNGEEEVLLKEDDPSKRVFSLSSDLAPGLAASRYQVSKGQGFIEYRHTEQGLLEITKRYNLYNSFDYIELELTIKNISPRNITFSYIMAGPSGIQQTGKVMGRRFVEADTLINGKVERTTSTKHIQEKTGDIGWTALKNRYFTAILKPLTPVTAIILSPGPGKEVFTAVKNTGLEIPSGGSTRQSFILYAGPQDAERLAAVGYNMQDIINYGFFGGVSKALLTVLRFFEKGLKNWGLAIIALTMLINAVLFPLTKKSFTSMHAMKKIQPHMQKLKEVHKDNPQKLNKEMMELYKKYNVNPLGGCLPMLLQMPIFIALYQGLIRSIELKGAHFLWIKDLARPDAVSLPFKLPVIGAHINILPLLMVGVMVIQQKLSQPGGAVTEEQASQQKMMMVMFPIVFGFLFYNMPSGLVLYWLTNSILMTAEQGMLHRKAATE